MKNKIIRFAVDEIEQVSLKDIDDDQFAKLRIKAFATGMTSHRYAFTKEALEDAAFTILNKPLLWYYNIWNDDAEGHESEGVFGKQEVPAGFVPKEDANLQIQKDADGRYFLYVDCYVWKLYSGKLMEIFSRTDGKKDVSVELLVIDSVEHQEENYTDVLKFCFTGITVLGEAISPAVSGASANVIKFSERESEFNKAKNDFEKRLYHSNIADNQEANHASFFNTKNNQMEVMNVMETEETKKSQSPELVENASKVTTVEVKKSIDTNLYDDNGMFIGNKYEKHIEETTTVEEVDETKPNAEITPDISMNEDVGGASTETGEVSTNSSECVNNACKTTKNADTVEETCASCKTECADTKTCATETTCSDNGVKCEEENYKEKCSQLEVKCSELESNYNDLLNKFDELKVECESLRAFKINKINEDNKKNIEIVLNSVSHILTSEQLDEWRNKSINCENVDEFTNQLKAFAFDIQSKNGFVPKDTLRNPLPKIENEEEDFWTRMAKKYNN